MHSKHRISTLALAALLVGACGGSGPGATPVGPAATSGGGGATAGLAATDQPAQTDTGGAGGTGGGPKPAGWDQYGKVHVDISGPVSRSTDLGFVPAGSIFGGAQGSSLNFTVDGTNEVLSILVGPDATVVVSYGGPEFSMPAAQCTTSSWNIGATSGSGSFDCTAVLTILASGASVPGGAMKGSFDVHA